MKKVVVADTGPIISLAMIHQVELIEKILGELYISDTVWKELTQYKNKVPDKITLQYLKKRVVTLSSPGIKEKSIDIGELSSIALYEKIQADYLLIDDQKVRKVAENANINCIGSIGLLVSAKKAKLVQEIRPFFDVWLQSKRYFSRDLLNKILHDLGEESLA